MTDMFTDNIDNYIINHQYIQHIQRENKEIKKVELRTLKRKYKIHKNTIRKLLFTSLSNTKCETYDKYIKDKCILFLKDIIDYIEYKNERDKEPKNIKENDTIQESLDLEHLHQNTSTCCIENNLPIKFIKYK